MGVYKLCLGCMEEKGQLSICPHCGYVEGESSDPSHLVPGTILNERYLIGRALRSNCEGINYIAYDKIIGCKVEITEYMPKLLCERLTGRSLINVEQKNLVQYKTLMSEYTEMHKQLARMRTLSHICPPLDIFSANNTTYVVFEYIDGMTLIQYLKENAGELSWDQVKKIFPPLFTTLSLIHNSGLLHRGISPETIYYTEDGELKLTGFCVAAARTAGSELKGALYTGYAAPEQYNSAERQGTWTDVYAVCAVLYRILTGCMPVEATGRLVNDNLIEPCETNSNVPKTVSRAIMDGMRLSGEGRIQTMTDLVTKLFQPEPAVEVRRPVERREPAAVKRTPAPAPVRRPAPAAEPVEARPVDTHKATLFEQIKVPILISCLLIAVVIIIIVLVSPLIKDMTGDSSSSSFAATDNSASKVEMTTTPPASVTTTVTTVTTSGISNNELYTLRNLVGQEYEIVMSSSTSRYVKLIVKEVFSDTVERGYIISQNIPAKEVIEKGSEVEIEVSLGPAVIDVPDCEGKDYTTAEYTDILVKAGIASDCILFEEYENDGTHKAGTVAFTSLGDSGKISLEDKEIIKVYTYKVAQTTAVTEAVTSGTSQEQAE